MRPIFFFTYYTKIDSFPSVNEKSLVISLTIPDDIVFLSSTFDLLFGPHSWSSGGKKEREKNTTVQALRVIRRVYVFLHLVRISAYVVYSR